MTGQAESKPRRPLWRLLLRYVGLTLTCLFGLLVVAFILVPIAINWHDEELSHQAKAWLIEPKNTLPDTDNAWLAMIAVGIEKEPGTVVGRKMLERLKSTPGSLDSDEALAEFGPPWSAKDFDPEICFIKPDGPDFFERIQAKKSALKKTLFQQQGLLKRYYTAIALPGFQDEPVYESVGGLPIQRISAASCLARIDLALRLRAQDKEAISQVVQHVRYGLRAIEGSQNMVTSLMANARIRLDIDFLQGLQKHDAALAKIILKKLQPELETFVAASISDILSAPMARAFRSSHRFLNESTSQAGSLEDWKKRILNLFFKPQASLNFRQQLMAEILRNPEAAYTSCDMSEVGLYTYNRLGQIFSCAGMPSYTGHVERVGDTQNEMAKLLAQAPLAAKASP